jgi:hypothetical protein
VSEFKHNSSGCLCRIEGLLPKKSVKYLFISKLIALEAVLFLPSLKMKQVKIKEEGREFEHNRKTKTLRLSLNTDTIMLNGVTQLVMMKADVLNIFDEIEYVRTTLAGWLAV